MNKVKQVLTELRPNPANPHVNSPRGLLEFRPFVGIYIYWIGMAGYNCLKKVIPLRLIETENVQHLAGLDPLSLGHRKEGDEKIPCKYSS